jgi:hypothetical protein
MAYSPTATRLREHGLWAGRRRVAKRGELQHGHPVSDAVQVGLRAADLCVSPPLLPTSPLFTRRQSVGNQKKKDGTFDKSVRELATNLANRHGTVAATPR